MHCFGCFERSEITQQTSPWCPGRWPSPFDQRKTSLIYCWKVNMLTKIWCTKPKLSGCVLGEQLWVVHDVHVKHSYKILVLKPGLCFALLFEYTSLIYLNAKIKSMIIVYSIDKYNFCCCIYISPWFLIIKCSFDLSCSIWVLSRLRLINKMSIQILSMHACWVIMTTRAMCGLL